MITIASLDRDQRAPYGAFTFPTFRPLLEQERPPPAVFGARSGADPIGLSFGFAAPNRQFELISLHVSPLWRGQGIGARLLGALEDHYCAQDCVLGAHFFTLNEDDQGFARFLMRRGWSRPAIRQVICRTTTERILASPLSAFARLPRGYRIVGWAEVTAGQKTAIRERSAHEPGWYPDELDPFRHERDCLLDTSIALLFGDSVVGWLFSHALDENTLRMTCSFVSKELERSGRVLHLWWDAGVRQDRLTTLKRSVWTVPVTYGNHVRFVMRHVKPWMESFAYACTSVKHLDGSGATAASDRS